MRYALLVCSDESAVKGADERSARLNEFVALVYEMLASGVLQSAARLHPTETATTVRVRNGDVVIADGPFADTKEQVGGFFLVDCKDLDEAIELAARIPAAREGTIEVRPIWEM